MDLKFNSENGEFVDYQSRAECCSYGCARCIVHEKQLGLKVKLPTMASIDYRGAIYMNKLECWWENMSCGIKQNFLWELKRSPMGIYSK